MKNEQLAVIETLNSGGDIVKLMSTMGADPVAFALATGAVIQAFTKVRDMVVIVCEDADLNQFLRAGPATIALAVTQKIAVPDNTWLKKYITAMCTVLTSAQKHGFSWTISEALTPVAATPVAVMSLPARETSSTVKYDSAGNIATTSQVEKDVL